MALCKLVMSFSLFDGNLRGVVLLGGNLDSGVALVDDGGVDGVRILLVFIALEFGALALPSEITLASDFVLSGAVVFSGVFKGVGE